MDFQLVGKIYSSCIGLIEKSLRAFDWFPISNENIYHLQFCFLFFFPMHNLNFYVCLFSAVHCKGLINVLVTLLQFYFPLASIDNRQISFLVYWLYMVLLKSFRLLQVTLSL